MGDVKSKFFLTTTASGTAVVAALAQPTSTFTLTGTSFGTNIGKQITATTAGTGDGGKTVAGGAIGSVNFRTTSVSGTALLVVRTNATEGNSTTVNIPQDGVYFPVGGAFVTFDETDCNAVTVYFDG